MKKNIKKISYVFMFVLFVILLLGAWQSLTNEKRFSFVGIFFKKTTFSTPVDTAYTLYVGDTFKGVDTFFIGDGNCYSVNKLRTLNIPFVVYQAKRKIDKNSSLLSICYESFTSSKVLDVLPTLISNFSKNKDLTYSFIQVGLSDIYISSFDFTKKKMSVWREEPFLEKDIWNWFSREDVSADDSLTNNEKFKPELLNLLNDCLEKKILSKDEVLERLFKIPSLPPLIRSLAKDWEGGRLVANKVPSPESLLSLIWLGLSVNEGAVDSLKPLLRLIQKDQTSELVFINNEKIISSLKQFLYSADPVEVRELLAQLKQGPLLDLFATFDQEREQMISRYEKNLDEAIRMLKKQNIETVLLTYALPDNSFPNKTIRFYAKKNNIAIIDLVEQAKIKKRDPRQFITFFGYLNSEGVKFYSEVISEYKNK